MALGISDRSDEAGEGATVAGRPSERQRAATWRASW